MNINPWRPMNNLMTLTDRLNRLLDEGFLGDYDDEKWGLTRWQPSTDIYETKEGYRFNVELPGFDKEDVSVELKDNTLLIRGEKKMDDKITKENYHRIERFYGSFQRSFILPQNAEGDKVEAKMVNGVLEITVPKSEQAKAKSIAVTVK
ncbi:MAG: Spore protein SP21 [Candidatus Aminicenantes bacterium ADurb.Bin508]|nr:MAG: Spore protein SP21 [Candidatus Aminicenantes bacterium ADurb.Bin508]HNX41743.1 Hsp20/alpha crystallin family protein [Candidatus Aminicenantes bacterium]HPB54498.1 Hsp20/alpha crystallin family protein [Candidatus Aminicenantes bacterium]HPS99884.1 Hsp20/alpha crystallin family protein [Candidatus Aminicenantes bacterium]